MKTGVLTIKSLFLDDVNVPRMKIKQSCNGLLLCSTTFSRVRECNAPIPKPPKEEHRRRILVEVRCGASPFSISRIIRAEKEEDSKAVCCILSDGMSNKLCDLQHESKFLTGGFNEAKAPLLDQLASDLEYNYCSHKSRIQVRPICILEA
ncbi:hypothetical protein NC651_029834 [Populus alba x Populus x berolinensis]|nr:hypothetical protein NC651_029834 [Populus alba x Populus x berolinensis]